MNENIINYIKNNYINSKMEPQFAVLVKGDWGCGKTFLVKKILKEAYGEKYEDKIIWLSVYGLSSIQQLRQKLFEKIHPILTSKVAKIAFATVKAGLKASTTFDFNRDSKDDLSFDLAIPDFEIDENGKKTSIKKLLIVDDVERCAIPISELFGFFSEEILERKVRTIFISNDEKIQNSESENTLNDYKSIKEKIIGIEFEVTPNTAEAVKTFIEEIGLKKYESILLEKTVYVLSNLKYENLRSIRQAFVHIGQVLSILACETLDEKYLETVIEYFLVLFIQRAKGELITSNDFLDAIEAYSKEHKTLKEYKEIHQKDNDILYRWSRIPLQNLYFNIIQEGDFSTQQILEDYKDWTTPDDKKTPYQKLIQEWFCFSDNEFSQYYESVQKQFDENTILNMSQILGWADLKFELSHTEIIHESVDDIKKSIIEYIVRNKTKLKSCDSFFAFSNHIIRCKEEIDTLNEIKLLLKEENDILIQEKTKNNFIRLYSNISENISELVRFIAYNDGNSFGIPILSQVDINDFYQKLKNCTYEYQVAIYQSFEDRYGKKHNEKLQEQYYPDIEKIKKIAEFYHNDMSNTFMSPENARRKWLSRWYKELYEYMNQFQNKAEES
ncbi:MAG: hypothetical protein IJP90_19070 [Treponema sp.]|nr:hypothetical protein [Treponema sp.]